MGPDLGPDRAGCEVATAGERRAISVFNCTQIRMAGMADHDLLLHPERWHDRALEPPAMARNTDKPQDRVRLLKVARAYDRMAARAQDWKVARERQRT
jgi:hypothetical protein